MASSQSQDTRLLERAIRRGELSQSEVEKELEKLPDLAESVERSSDADVERLRAEFEAEGVARAERVERFLEEGPLPVVRPEPVPIDESDL